MIYLVTQNSDPNSPIYAAKIFRDSHSFSFEHEYGILQQLHHPNFPVIIDGYAYDHTTIGSVYVMELVEG